MPYIHATISKDITPKQKASVKDSLGELIARIPDKSESVLMLRIDDGAPMFFQGQAQDCAYVGIHLYTQAPLEAKQDFSSAFVRSLSQITDIPPSNIFMTFTEYPNWVADGNLK
ncbi:MAG: hypothetical protein ACOYI4_05900 [Christensenellales bacterium]